MYAGHFCSHQISGTAPNMIDCYLIHNGRKIDVNQLHEIKHGIVHIVPRLRGGKGGFGSMLRAIGAQIEKTTNREACRDLSGRRLRDINEEKRLKKWLSEQGDREREAAEKKRKKLEKLCSEPQHDFQDKIYEKERTDMIEKVHEAIEEGLKACSSSAACQPSTSQGVKRKRDEKSKGMLWVDEEFGSESSECSDEEDEIKKLKL